MKRKLIKAGIIVFSVVVIAAAVLLSGVLVHPSRSSLAKAKEVQQYDILQDQSQRELDILSDYAVGTYNPETPYILQDPYTANPLSALVIFETEKPARVTLIVEGKDAYTTFTDTELSYLNHHEIEVLGLYPENENRIRLELSYEDGQQESFVQTIQTEPLPYDFPNFNIMVSKPDQMEPGIDSMTPCFDVSYTYLLDARGDVRGYFTNKDFGHGTGMRLLQNGHLLVTGDVTKLMPYNMYTLWEMDLLGRVYVEYEIPNAVHHDIIELENGDFLAVSNNVDVGFGYDTREDVLIRIDRETGLVEKEYNLRDILDEHRTPFHHFDPDVKNPQSIDWSHLNTVVMDETDNSIITSSPIQSAVVKFDADSMQINWILSSPQGWDGEFSRFQQYLLTPIGSGFEWQWGQHAPMILPDKDNNPDTVDLLMFDNGQSKSFYEENAVNAPDNYSRAVIYRINEVNRTVEQLWQYGKELGSGAYATFLGDADFLPRTGNVNIAFGGMLRNDGVPVDDIVGGVIGNQQIRSRVTEVQPDGTVVFDVMVTPNHTSSAETYQITKMDLFNEGLRYQLNKFVRLRKGVVQSSPAISYNLPKIFIPRLDVTFTKLYEKDNHLILQGSFLYQGKEYLLGKLLFVLKNSRNEYVFSAISGLNSIFYARIDLMILNLENMLFMLLVALLME